MSAAVVNVGKNSSAQAVVNVERKSFAVLISGLVEKEIFDSFNLPGYCVLPKKDLVVIIKFILTGNSFQFQEYLGDVVVGNGSCGTGEVLVDSKNSLLMSSSKRIYIVVVIELPAKLKEVWLVWLLSSLFVQCKDADSQYCCCSFYAAFVAETQRSKDFFAEVIFRTKIDSTSFSYY